MFFAYNVYGPLCWLECSLEYFSLEIPTERKVLGSIEVRGEAERVKKAVGQLNWKVQDH